MKKVLKIIALYLLFGIIIAIAISILSGYNNLLIHNTMGNMGVQGYAVLMLAVIAIWLPSFVFLLFSRDAYLTFAFAKPFLAVVVVAFVLFSILIMRTDKKSKNKKL